MSRRTIVMVTGAAVVVAGAIALAIMTRGEPAPLKAERRAARESSPLTMNASTTPSPQNSSAAAPAIQAREVAAVDGDVAEPGNGSSGELLQRLADQYAQHHWPEAMAACLNPDVAIAGAKQCAIAACELHDTMHARRFFVRVTGADRAAVRAECESVRVPIERPMRPWLGAHRRPPFRSPIVSPAGSGG